MEKVKSPHKVYRLVARVKSVYGLKKGEECGKGPCEVYRPGDEIILDKFEIHGKICYAALASMMHKVWAMRLGFDPPWAPKPGLSLHMCPDAARPVVFEIIRVEE